MLVVAVVISKMQHLQMLQVSAETAVVVMEVIVRQKNQLMAILTQAVEAEVRCTIPQ